MTNEQRIDAWRVRYAGYIAQRIMGAAAKHWRAPLVCHAVGASIAAELINKARRGEAFREYVRRGFQPRLPDGRPFLTELLHNNGGAHNET
jgi:hypothetical protein